MSRAEPIRCPYCRERHMPRYLCDPAKTVLDAMVARGRSFTMPTVAFDEPVTEPTIGQPGDLLVQQVVVKAAAIPAAGVAHPALVFTGRTLTQVLPHWIFPAADDDIRAIARLVHDMAELAIRTADNANQQGSPPA